MNRVLGILVRVVLWSVGRGIREWGGEEKSREV